MAPELVVTLANRPQFSALGWGMVLLVGLIGLALTRGRPAGRLLPGRGRPGHAGPLVVDSLEAAYVCNQVFYAVCILAVYYLAAGAVRWLAALCCSCCRPRPPQFRPWRRFSWSCALPARECGSRGSRRETANGRSAVCDSSGEPSAPVEVPEDAISCPMIPTGNGLKDANKLLIPYDKYVELWNRAHPDKGSRQNLARALLAGRGGVQDAVGRRRLVCC